MRLAMAAIILLVAWSAPAFGEVELLDKLFSRIEEVSGEQKIGRLSPIEQLDVSPGIQPEAMRAFFAARLDDLRACMSLLDESARPHPVLLAEKPDADERAELSFAVTGQGSLKSGSVRLKSVFLREPCAKQILEKWKLPMPASGREVEVKARFKASSTLAERKALLARVHGEFRDLCEISGKIKAGPDLMKNAVAAFLGKNPLPTRYGGWMGVLLLAEAHAWADIFQESARAAGLELDCPALRSLAKRPPEP